MVDESQRRIIAERVLRRGEEKIKWMRKLSFHKWIEVLKLEEKRDKRRVELVRLIMSQKHRNITLSKQKSFSAWHLSTNIANLSSQKELIT